MLINASYREPYPQVEEDLVVEKSKIKQVSDDLNAVFEDLMWLMYVLIDWFVTTEWILHLHTKNANKYEPDVNQPQDQEMWNCS